MLYSGFNPSTCHLLTHSDKLELHIALSAMNYAKNARRTRRLKS